MKTLSRSTKFAIILLLIAAVIKAVYLGRSFPFLESEETIASNVGFFLLINLNIIAVMVLGFIVIRNIFRLLLDRKRNILGARLRSRLVFAFVMLSLVPTTLLFFVAQGIIERVLQDWFSPRVELALTTARNLASNYYYALEDDVKTKGNNIANRFVTSRSTEPIRKFQDEKAFNLQFIEDVKSRHPELNIKILILDQQLADAINENKRWIQIDDNQVYQVNSVIEQELLLRVSNEMVILTGIEKVGLKEYIRLYIPVSCADYISKKYNDQICSIIVLSHLVPSKVSEAVSSVLLADDEFREFRSYRRPLASSYFLTLVVVTLLVIFAAISVGFFLAKGLAVPIGLLAKGTEQVAHGNLSYQIPEIGDDELGILVKGFNKMTTDLKDTTDELVSRRRYIETVLANVGVGVISLDSSGKVSTVNRSAFEILEVEFKFSAFESHYQDIFPTDFVTSLDEIFTRSMRGRTRVATRSLFYSVNGRVKHLQVMVSKLFEESRQTELGMVILVDDVTELERAQRMAAWQEVARRIAHEIKNPLTPIQLSAERISRMKSRLGSRPLSEEESRLIDEATGVITTHVENLRVLVNEFSQFARMPKSELSYGDINQVLLKSVENYKVSNPEILFEINLENSLPTALYDSFQMERVCINLFDNAIAAVKDANTKNPCILVESRYDQNASLLILEFSDNGTGVPDSEKGSLFEPYYTKKRGGTGLGLAIVKTVIADHNGFIRALDSKWGGLLIRIELPAIK
ncbi:MAG TPA: ATP-binding protein [Oligoflexia bacterium]|nr:ATP-binding protein [Oligoflexia bacterium]HMP49670.1 ATP-binding protein [Oligoflexia bacterium]